MLRMPRGEMLARMDSAELSEWLAFDSEFNLPDGFYQTATLGCAVVRSMSGQKVEPADFAPIYEGPSREQSPAEAKARFAAFAAAHNRRQGG